MPHLLRRSIPHLLPSTSTSTGHSSDSKLDPAASDGIAGDQAVNGDDIGVQEEKKCEGRSASRPPAGAVRMPVVKKGKGLEEDQEEEEDGEEEKKEAAVWGVITSVTQSQMVGSEKMLANLEV
jgi:hypothetical protein